MNKTYDAIIIGAGVIGCPIAYELAKMGYKTLNVDKLADAGEGSTAGSCAIVRAHYSTEDGVAMAYEGFQYWLKWEEYLDHVEDEKGLARYMNTGSILLKSQGHDWRKVQSNYDAVGVKYEEWSIEKVKEVAAVYELDEFWPVRRPEDPHFFDEPVKKLEGALFCPEGGYMSDPALSAHNIMRAAEAKGSEFLFKAEVVDIRSKDGQAVGITLKDGTQIDAPVIVNVGGPHSYKINQMAEGVYEGCNIKTKALRHEVMHCPSPEGYDYYNDGYHTSDGDLGCYYRPEVGNMFLIGSEDPECDPQEWVDPDEFYAGKGGSGRDNQLTDAQWKAQCYRLARRVPTLQIPNQPRGVCDLYDCSDDWIPIYDKSDMKGFYMAIGSSGNQYKNAPIAGLMMAQLIDACEKGMDHDKEPLQFKLPYTGRIIDVGFFSRKREINYNSSFSVNG
ncbi:MAG: FAD-binding oxidoreductase [Desulfobacteraceae bacterium 4572_123]|nr:MAG: FAD-binding oxidoreductase [Desulfobacteraceae bacterium 4572_123]